MADKKGTPQEPCGARGENEETRCQIDNITTDGRIATKRVNELLTLVENVNTKTDAIIYLQIGKFDANIHAYTPWDNTSLFFYEGRGASGERSVSNDAGLYKAEKYLRALLMVSEVYGKEK